jgi:hypothetical protein
MMHIGLQNSVGYESIVSNSAKPTLAALPSIFLLERQLPARNLSLNSCKPWSAACPQRPSSFLQSGQSVKLWFLELECSEADVGDLTLPANKRRSRMFSKAVLRSRQRLREVVLPKAAVSNVRRDFKPVKYPHLCD